MKVIVAALAAVVLLAGCSSGTGSPAKSPASSDPASLLAKYDGSSDLAAYSAALDAWQAQCTESRVTVAGYADAAYRDEQKNGGADSSRLAVMQNLATSVPAGVAPTDCNAITAAYLVTVEG